MLQYTILKLRHTHTGILKMQIFACFCSVSDLVYMEFNYLQNTKECNSNDVSSNP